MANNDDAAAVVGAIVLVAVGIGILALSGALNGEQEATVNSAPAPSATDKKLDNNSCQVCGNKNPERCDRCGTCFSCDPRLKKSGEWRSVCEDCYASDRRQSHQEQDIDDG